jgi:hypothetical protein
MTLPQASHYLSQVVPGRSNSRMSREEWQGDISNCSAETGNSAAVCAQMLSPRAQMEKNAVSNVSVTPDFGFGGFQEIRGDMDVENTGNLYSGMGRLEGLRGAQSFRAGTNPEPNDIVLNENQAIALASAQASGSPRQITKAGKPANRSTLDSTDIRRVAQALGVSTQGDAKTVAQNVRVAVGGMTPRTQGYYSGGMSPRSVGTVNRLMNGY